MKNFPEKLAQEILEKIIDFLKGENIISDKQEILVSIVPVSKKEVKDLNKKYREKNESTDILSFGYKFDEEVLEGDLILCWDIIKENAEEDKIEPEQELIKNLIHGCLHLTGREHSDEMFDLQNKFLNNEF